MASALDRELIRRRIVALGLAVPDAADPAEAVRRLGCAQGQDLPGVIASLALRVPAGTADAVTAAMTSGTVVRGYPMRGTVFAVHADDLAWMGELLRPSFRSSLAKRREHLGVTLDDFHRARDIALTALADVPREGLTRTRLGALWAAAGIGDGASGLTYHLISTLMIEGFLVYGSWDPEVREQRVVAATAWLPAESDLEGRFNGDRVAAIAAWLRCYLDSHGPATLRDFAWWTKLGLGEIRKAAPAAVEGLAELGIGGETAYARPEIAEPDAAALKAADRAMLLPGFDELVLGYGDRSFLLSEANHRAAVPGNNGMFRGLALDLARPLATWKRAGSGTKRRLELTALPEAPAVSQRARRDLNRCFADHPWVTP